LPETAETPIIMLTPKALSTDVDLGYAAGADDYIILPADPIEYLAHVRGLIRRRRQIAKSAQPLPPPPDPEDYETGGPVADRMLVVDDDPDITRFIQVNMLGHPHGSTFREVDVAGDGEEALRMVEEHRYDFITTDLSHPRIDGLELVRLLRRRADTETTPIIICTAKPLPADKPLGFFAGADDYLPKAFDPTELRARARALLRRKGRTAPVVPTD
jgi:DNA-binding response OmpR family regulator